MALPEHDLNVPSQRIYCLANKRSETLMKILILSRYGHLGASSRLRTEQFIPHLHAAGFEVTFSPLLSDAYLLKSYSGKATRIDALRGMAKRALMMRKARQFDVIWIEKECLPWAPFLVENLLLPSGVPYVLDFDDAVFHQYDLHQRPLIRWLLGTKLDRLMRGAAAVFAGNDYLADRARQAGAVEVNYVPTVLNPDHYVIRTEADWQTKAQAVIGWIGSPSTWKAHMQPICDNLIAIAGKKAARIEVVGAQPFPEQKGVITFLPWSEDTEGSITAGFSLGVMPLTDDPWARGKCGYKLLQYMASGIPVVASPVGVNKNIVEPGINGFLAVTNQDWALHIESLLGDPVACCKLGQAGRAKVVEQYSIQTWGPKVAALLLRIATSKSTGI